MMLKVCDPFGLRFFIVEVITIWDQLRKLSSEIAF